ncbi:MAG: hypothetical protein WC595_03295 [Candidatus Nanoarchaeia archaeon]
METQRQTAYKIWISNLLSGTYTHSAGEWEPNYIQSDDKKISRVNLIGHVVDKFVKAEQTSTTLLIDDGTEKIPIRAWKEESAFLAGFEVGDLLLVIAKVRDYNNRIYLTPEIITKLDNPLWAKLRNLELKKLLGEAKSYARDIIRESIQTERKEETNNLIIEEKVVNEPVNQRQLLLDLIEKLDTNNGADQHLVLQQAHISSEDAKELLDNLIKEGEIFEIHPGKFRTTL